MPRNKKWDDVLQKLSPLPIQGDKYLFTESATDSYTNPEFKTDHPSVFGAFGMLPKTPHVKYHHSCNTHLTGYGITGAGTKPGVGIFR